jgi:hypothetical protein
MNKKIIRKIMVNNHKRVPISESNESPYKRENDKKHAIKNSKTPLNVKNPNEKEVLGNGVIIGMTQFYDTDDYLNGCKFY